MQSTSDPISASFCQIYSENYQWLNRWLQRHLQSTQNLEDIAQDTFLKLFVSKKAHLIREPKAYLASTARCIAIDQIRHELVEKRYQEYIQNTHTDETYHSPEQMIIVLELLHRMAAAVSGLAERPRQCLLMYYLEALPQEQIAKHLNISRRTVQLDLVKAMVHCHQWISDHA